MAVSPEERIGRFVLIRRLGASSLATVYEARDADTGTPVALKVLSRYVAEDPRLVEEFFSRTRQAAALRHPHIVSLVDVGRDGSCWVATELMAGGSLKARSQAALDPAEVARVLAAIASALDAAHAVGLLHGDLKPANVLMTATGDYKLADFGMAGLAGGMHALVRSSSSTPYPPYMSPEQALDMTLTPRGDVYSLGALAYHLLTAEVPFAGMDPTTVWAKQIKGPPLDPSTLNPQVPSTVSRVVLTALAMDPRDRFASATELAEAFVGALARHPVRAGAAGAREAGVAPTGARVAALGTDMSPGTVPAAGSLSARAPHWAKRIAGEAVPASGPGAHGRARGGLAGRSFDKVGELARSGLTLAAAILTALLIAFTVSRLTLPSTPLSSVSAIPAPGQWAMYQRDPLHSGYAPGPSPSLQGTVRWSFLMAQPLSAAPAVDADTVYLATGDRRVVALRAGDGSVRWELPVATPLDSAPALAGDMVYVALRSGAVVAVDRASGVERWSRDTGGAIFSSPVVYKGMLYIGTATGNLEAIDAKTGKLLWRFQADEEIDSPPAITEEGVLVFGSRDGNVYFLDAGTGRARLVYRTVVSASSGPAVQGKIAYVGVDNGSVVAVDTTRRQRPFDKQVLRVKNQLYTWEMWPHPSVQRGHVWAVNAARSSASTPAVAGSLLVIATQDGKVQGMEKQTGRRVWSFTTGTTVALPPIVVGDTAYVSSTGGKVYGLHLETGKLVWQWDASVGGLGPSTGPVVAEGVLYVGASQQRAPIAFLRIAEDGSTLPNDPEAAGRWYYRYGGSPCSPGEKIPVGPFSSLGEATSEANFRAPSCGGLYAIQ